MDRLEFNQELAEMARLTADDMADEQTLDRAVRLPVELIENCSRAGISYLRHHPTRGGVDSPAVSHEDVRLINELQYKLDEGPLVELRHHDTVVSGDVDTDNRWSRWGAHVADQYDIRSAMAFRLFTDGNDIAALTLYSEEPDAFTRDDLVDGLALAAPTGITLAAALELDQMHTALRSRQVIGEAVGMLRERFQLSSDQAFGVLKRLSSQHNVKIVHLARQVVDTGQLPSADPRD